MKKNMKQKFVKKIKSSKGETLVELMVAILVGVFSCILLSQVIATSTNLDSQSRVTFSAYYAQENELTKAFSGEASTLEAQDGNIVIKGLEIKDTNGTVYYKNNVGRNFGYDVEYYINGNISGEEVVSYRLVK